MAPADIQYDQLLDADSLVVTRFPLAWDQVISPDTPIIARLEPMTKSFGNLNYKSRQIPDLIKPRSSGSLGRPEPFANGLTATSTTENAVRK